MEKFIKAFPLIFLVIYSSVQKENNTLQTILQMYIIHDLVLINVPRSWGFQHLQNKNIFRIVITCIRWAFKSKLQIFYYRSQKLKPQTSGQDHFSINPTVLVSLCAISIFTSLPTFLTCWLYRLSTENQLLLPTGAEF